MMAIAGIIPVAKWLAKIKQRSDLSCRLIIIMQKETRTSRCEHEKLAGRDAWAHQQCFLRWNSDNRHGCPPLHLETSVCQAAQTPASKLRFVILDKESSMSTLWQEEEFEQICSRESLTEKAADIEKNDICERARKGTI